jgi:hypothetical protein
MGILRTPAYPYDCQELLDFCSHHLTCVLRDGGSHDAALPQFLIHTPSLQVPAPHSPSDQRQLTRVRVIGETVSVQVHKPWHVSMHAAKHPHGLRTRRAANMMTQSVGMMVNTRCGRPI